MADPDEHYDDALNEDRDSEDWNYWEDVHDSDEAWEELNEQG